MADAEPSKWVTLDVERVLYVDRGRDVILCDRLEMPGDATLVLRISSKAKRRLIDDLIF